MPVNNLAVAKWLLEQLKCAEVHILILRKFLRNFADEKVCSFSVEFLISHYYDQHHIKYIHICSSRQNLKYAIREGKVDNICSEIKCYSAESGTEELQFLCLPKSGLVPNYRKIRVIFFTRWVVCGFSFFQFNLCLKKYVISASEQHFFL